MRCLVAIPVYNEQKYVAHVLERVLGYASDILVIDDGSTDATPSIVAGFPVEVIRHATNRGYGRSLLDAFRWAAVDQFDWIITMDCDDQHEPEAIPRFIQAIQRNDADIISGSRYLVTDENGDSPPPQRRAINLQITDELNERLGLTLTDAFCGFKAYRVESLRNLELDVDGYAFPMQFWVQSVAAGLTIRELPVRLIYNDANRSFGGPLDDAGIRVDHYRSHLVRELVRLEDKLPASALVDLEVASACCRR